MKKSIVFLSAVAVSVLQSMAWARDVSSESSASPCNLFCHLWMKDEPQSAPSTLDLHPAPAAPPHQTAALAHPLVAAGQEPALLKPAVRKGKTPIKGAALQSPAHLHPAKPTLRSHVGKRKEPDAIEALLRAEPVAMWQPASVLTAPVVVAVIAAPPEPTSLRPQAEPAAAMPSPEPIVLPPVPEAIVPPPPAAPSAAMAAADAPPAVTPAAMIAVEPQATPTPVVDRQAPAILPAFDVIAQILLAAPRTP